MSPEVRKLGIEKDIETAEAPFESFVQTPKAFTPSLLLGLRLFAGENTTRVIA
jgi:cytochrome c peroxidase